MVDHLARRAITTGGLLVIVAVLGILFYLVVVVAPLFRAPHTSAATGFTVPHASHAALLAIGVDPFQALGFALFDDGAVSLFALADGRPVATHRLALPAAVTAFQYHPADESAAFGLADGRVATAHLGFTVQLLAEERRPASLPPLAPGESRPWQEGLATRLPEGQYRITTLAAEVDDLLEMDREGAPITLVDLRRGSDATVLVSHTGSGRLRLSSVTRRENFLTGQIRTEVEEYDLPTTRRPTQPRFLLVTGAADQCYLAWGDGTVVRFDLRNLNATQEVEEVDLLPDPGATLTDLRFLLGEQSLVATDDRGGVNVWFRIRPPAGQTARGSDGNELALAHRLASQTAAITATGISSRDKGLITAAADGSVWLRHATSERLLKRLHTASPVRAVAFAPKGDGLLAAGTDGRIHHWQIDNPHPEVTTRALFAPVWYEGYPAPAHVWQSSSGSDDFEPKLGLVPMIFGTLKATLFAMLFALPVALLGAIYTAEFLHPKTRAVVKPAIEMMASLPSVVLGFIAALVMAPVVESWIVSCLLIFAGVPLVAMACGYLWQALPRTAQRRLSNTGRLALTMVAVAATCWLAPKLGPAVERVAFGGDFRAWLEQRAGSGAPLWFLLVWPVAALAGVRFKRILDRSLARLWPRRAGVAELVAALAYGAGTAAAAITVALACTTLGWDLRGPLLGTYVQRNSLIVGFVMGFAVIPIIYTISEEALSAVPAHLRSASLACGATPWQTAVRVVLPTAASGILGAAMVGLGRAVGETMIVVMAAGNTPLLDINPFNGLRALSANIAVELPEAVKDSTLYRVLFLAALILFAMTFVVNTVAEVVRLRFRRRAFQL